MQLQPFPADNPTTPQPPCILPTATQPQPNCYTTTSQPSYHAPTTTQPSFVSNPRTIPTQPSHILDSPTPTATQPLAKGFVRRRPKAHGASANTPYPFARTFAPPPHCRRINRGRFAASTTRCRRHQTLSCPMPPLTLVNGKQDRRTPRGTQQPLHRSRLRGCRGRPPLCLPDPPHIDSNRCHSYYGQAVSDTSPQSELSPIACCQHRFER